MAEEMIENYYNNITETTKVKEVVKLLKTVLVEAGVEVIEEPKEITTSTGHKWIVTQDKALDVATGLNWDLKSRGEMSFDAAMKKFDTMDCRLPSKEEWLEAAGHGITEVIPEIINNRHWTASVSSDIRGFAWYFFADAFGYVGVNSFYRHNDFGVRCVGR